MGPWISHDASLSLSFSTRRQGNIPYTALGSYVFVVSTANAAILEIPTTICGHGKKNHLSNNAKGMDWNPLHAVTIFTILRVLYYSFMKYTIQCSNKSEALNWGFIRSKNQNNACNPSVHSSSSCSFSDGFSKPPTLI